MSWMAGDDWVGISGGCNETIPPICSPQPRNRHQWVGCRMDGMGFICVSVFGNLFDLSAMSLALGEERGGTCSRCKKKPIYRQ